MNQSQKCTKVQILPFSRYRWLVVEFFVLWYCGLMERVGPIQQKTLLFLQTGLVLGFTRSPKAYFKILKGVAKEWRDIEKRALKRAIDNLYKSKMVDMKYNKKKDAVTIILTDKGKKKALTFNLSEIQIKKPQKWDWKWRIVLFDISEPYKKQRDAFRCLLKRLGFFEYQKSVFVHPFDCKDEIDYVVEFWGIRKFVRFVVADSLDNELHLKDHFGLK